jgi:site-specific recombinase XerC
MALGLLDRDPKVGISPPRVERHEIRFLTPEEVERLLEVTRGTDIGDLIAVAVMTGSITNTANIYGHLYATHLDRMGKSVEIALQGGPRIIRLPRR